jgi:hypothetical protein
MVWAAISPKPHIRPELMTCVLTGWTAKQFWYHFHNFNISQLTQREILDRDTERERERESEREGDYGPWKIMPFCNSILAFGLNIQMYLLSKL